MTDKSEAAQYAGALGYAAGAVALLQALVAASIASAHQPDVLALQRGLLEYRDNSGGPWVDPQIANLIPMVVAYYVTAAISLAATLGLAWYAGRLTVLLGGALRPAVAGRRIAWISWLCWAVATLLAVLVLRADATFSWAAATTVKLEATPAAQPVSGLYISAPDGAFLGIQALALLIQLGAGLLVGIYLGGIAAESGARRALLARKPATSG
jgi:hypothetical protein